MVLIGKGFSSWNAIWKDEDIKRWMNGEKHLSFVLGSIRVTVHPKIIIIWKRAHQTKRKKSSQSLHPKGIRTLKVTEHSVWIIISLIHCAHFLGKLLALFISWHYHNPTFLIWYFQISNGSVAYQNISQLHINLGFLKIWTKINTKIFERSLWASFSR